MLVEVNISVAQPNSYWQEGFMHDGSKLQSRGVHRDSIVVLVCVSMPAVGSSDLHHHSDNMLTCPQLQ